MKLSNRYFEILLGIIITLLLLGKYCSAAGCRSLLSYIIPVALLRPVVFIMLVIVASRLIAGKPKDYSKFFYHIMVKVFGDPKKKDRDV
jgi:hypothetical protein